MTLQGDALLRQACYAAQRDPLSNPGGKKWTCNVEWTSALRHDLHSPWHCKRFRGNLSSLIIQKLGFPYSYPVAIRKSASEAVGHLFFHILKDGTFEAQAAAIAAARSPFDASAFWWAFVRDPLAHFISGYVELESRLCENPWQLKAPEWNSSELPGWLTGRAEACAWQRKHVDKFFMRGPLGSVARVRAFVHELVAETLGDLNSNGDINHVFTQMYWFCGHEPLLNRRGWLAPVGQLENFDEDLQTILLAMGLSEPSARLVVARLARWSAAQTERNNRASSAGDLSRRVAESVRTAIRSDPSTRQTLCYLLIPDYLTLNRLLVDTRRYEMPVECRGLVADISGIAARASIAGPDRKNLQHSPAVASHPAPRGEK